MCARMQGIITHEIVFSLVLNENLDEAKPYKPRRQFQVPIYFPQCKDKEDKPMHQWNNSTNSQKNTSITVDNIQ